ncbi:MAG: hypothetical protein MJK18_14825 [Bdellovibrionales bacterium]|nr:hypothetical protein [Bdellovibrionales bacterium]
MKIQLFAIILVFTIVGCSTSPNDTNESDLEISLFHENKFEKEAKAILLSLEKQYDLSPFIMPNKIIIRSRSIPHSHPVLTLNTRLIKNEDGFLSTFLHEQMHWFLTDRKNKEDIFNFIAEMKKKYPKIPVGKKEGGAKDAHSSYLHLAVCYLELESTKSLIGEERARSYFGKSRTYRWIKKEVLSEHDWLTAQMKKHNLLF